MFPLPIAILLSLATAWLIVKAIWNLATGYKPNLPPWADPAFERFIPYMPVFHIVVGSLLLALLWFGPWLEDHFN